MNKKVSIIIPFYNVGNSICKTIKSVKEQTYQNIEVMLVNDGSTDNSESVVNSLMFGDSRFNIIKIDNSGPARARVIGLNNCSGDYLFFLDADDVLHKRAIEIMVENAEQYFSDVVVCNYETFSTDVPISDSQNVSSSILSHEMLMSELAVCKRIQNFIWGKLFRKEIISTNDFDQSKRLGEDISTMFKIFKKCNSGLFIEGQPLVFYKQSQNSLSHRLTYSKINDYCDALIEKTDFYCSNYKQLYSLTFNANLDFWLLVILNYDLRRVYNISSLKKHINQTCHGFKNKIKLFIANHPGLAKKILKKSIRKKEHLSSKKKIAVINTYNRMSTGNVAKSIMDGINLEYDSKLFYGRCKDKWDNESVYIGGCRLLNFLNNMYVKLTGKIGGAHKRATKRLIKKLDEYRPDIIHLHNIHGNFLNYKMLFCYLKDKRVVVTMHDCFWLTGRCAHFISESSVCDEWKNGCRKCPHKDFYMATLFFDRAKKQFELKQKFFAECKNLSLVALSNWQKELFHDDKVRLIHNGFDYSVPNPLKNNSKITIVGVSQVWNKSKGALDFNYLVDNLDLNKYEIVLVGKKAKKVKLDERIKLLGPLSEQETKKVIGEADIFVNPTYVDTFPTVLIEALCCGIPPISYDVGGCRDIVGDAGILVPRGDKNALLDAINDINLYHFSRDNILIRAKLFKREKMVDNYLKLFSEVLNER